VPAQITTSGAMAITGVTCRVTVIGCTARSNVSLSAASTARPWPSRLAIKRAASALAMV
jgi:hypothetical protein